jgi:hypothetical protein
MPARFALALLLPFLASAQISGSVRDSVTKLPIAGVTVAIRGATHATALSDDTGRFRCEDAPPGKYMALYSKKGYDQGSASFEIKAADNPLTLELRPWSELEGTVLDEDGRPLEGIPVYIGGLRDTTGKDGRYHARDITAGQYTLSFQVPYELRRRMLARDPKTGETFGYATTHFYPGIADPRLGSPITILPGSHMTNVDARLRRARLVEMKGRVVGALPETEIELDSRSDRPDETFARRRLDADGGFHFDLLAARDYNVAIFRNRPGDDLPYLTTVTLGQAGAQDLHLVLPGFVRLEGVVRTMPSDIRWDGPLRITLNRFGYRTEARVSSQSAFTLDAIPPGEWNLTLDDNLVHRADDPKHKLFATGIRGQSLRVTESGNPPLEITLSDRTGWIRGISDTVGMVLLNAGNWIRMAPVDKTGAFAFEVPPGEYTVTCGKQSLAVTVQSATTALVHLRSCERD